MSTRTGRSERSFDDRGITLVELLVTAAITAVLGVVAATVTVSTWKTQQVRSVSSDRSAAAKAATELLSRDLRDARSVVINRTGVGADSPGSVTVWDDRNLDYRAQPSERATWARDGTGRLCRTTAVPSTRCVTASTATITFQGTAAPTGGNRAVSVSLTAGPDSPARTWSVALENLR